MLPLRHTFASAALYHQKHDEPLGGFLARRWSFWLALFSCIAFLVGNMVGQHGWRAFWKSVWGKEAEIVFTGTVPPLPQIPDPDRWSGSHHVYTFDQVPEDLRIPLPQYEKETHCQAREWTDRRVYSVPYQGRYADGSCGGSHPGADILVPVGAPVQSIANGIVEKVDTREWGFGYTVVVKHPNVPHQDDPDRRVTLYSSYAHLSEILVAQGDVVDKGQLIARTGDTGYATAPHIEFGIAKSTSPSKPAWPFTSQEANERGFSFQEAVNNGLGAERTRRYTVDPMLYVQKYAQWADVPLVEQEQESVGAGTLVASTVDIEVQEAEPAPKTWVQKLKERLAKQRQERLERRKARIAARIERRKAERLRAEITSEPVQVAGPAPEMPSEPVAEAEDTPPVPEEESAPVEQIPDVRPIVPVPNHGDLASISMLHDGEFDRQKEVIAVFARDAKGNFLKTLRFEGSLSVEISFGEAELSQTELTAEDFDERGRAFLELIPRGQKSVIVSIRGPQSTNGRITADSQPLVYRPQNESTRVSER